MIKICEECGTEYSSYSLCCPKCGCPNLHVKKSMDLSRKREEAEQAIGDSLSNIFFCVVIFLVLNKLFHQPVELSLFMAAILSTIMTIFKVNVIVAFILLIVLCFIMVSGVPKWIQDLAEYSLFLIPAYTMFVRPVLKVIKIRNIEKKKIKVHQEDVEQSNWEYVSQPHEEAKSPCILDKQNAIDVDFNEKV